jgi:transketolase
MKIKLSDKQKALRRRILEISYKNKYSHLGSCLSCVDLISAIYDVKNKEDKFVLSNGHAGIALYAVLERRGILKRKEIDSLHIHPDRDVKKGIHVSTGSLGQGLPIALGMALAEKRKNVYCIISDGECAEGSIWESLRLTSDLSVKNLTIILNANGWSAYNSISLKSLFKRLKSFDFNLVKVNGHDPEVLKNAITKYKNTMSIIIAKTTVEQFNFLKGLDAHYHVMDEDEYNTALRKLS